MNFINYSKPDLTLNVDPTVSTVEDSTKFTTTSAVEPTSRNLVLKESSSAVGTNVEYMLDPIIPDGANVLKKSVTIWGVTNGARRIAGIYDNMSRKLLLDAKYSNLEYEFVIDYEDSNKEAIRLEGVIKADPENSFYKLNMSSPGKSFESLEEFVLELKNEINRLKIRIRDLENK